MKYLQISNYFLNYLTLNLLSIFFYSGIYYYLLKKNINNFNFPNVDIQDILVEEEEINKRNQIIKNKLQQNESTYLNAIYFAVITQLSIGYGDVTPRSNNTKIVSICQGVTILIITFVCFSTLFQNYEILTKVE